MTVSVINQWPISAINCYQPETAAVTNTTSNALVVVIGWTANTYVPGTTNPISWVADDAHNFWTHLVTSTSVTTMGAGSRCSIWLCPDASAATIVSVATSGYVLGLTAECFELPGVPTLAYADSVASNYTASGTSLTVSGLNITNGDTLLAVCHVPNTTGSISTPAFWTALNTVSGYDTGFGHGGPCDSLISPFWAVAGSTGPITVTFPWSGSSVPMSAAAVSISSQSKVYTIQRASRPVIIAEAAFGASPGEALAPPVYTDITAYAINTQGDTILSAQRGRQYELTQVEAGDIALNLDNHTGVFCPTNSGSPFYPNLLVNTPIRVSAIWNNKQYPVCAGNVERWPQTWVDPQWGMTPMEATDAIGPLSNINLPSALQGEVLIDSPYVYCPCSEDYTEATGLPCSNIARGNQRDATYMDAVISYSPSSTRPLATGLALNLLGDMGTGVGYDSITTGPDVTPMPGVFYTDPALSTVMSGSMGMTVEFWMIIPTNRSASTGMEVFRLQGNSPNYYLGTATNGGFGVRFLVYLNGNTQVSVLAADFKGNTQTANWSQTVADGNLHHYSFTVTSTATGSFTMIGYLDGAQQFTHAVTGLTGGMNDVWWMSWGPQMYWNGGTAFGNNYTIGQVGLFQSVLPYPRLQAHHSVGSAGSGNDPAVTRFGKLLCWGNYGGPRAGSTSSPSPMFGPADQIEQTTISSQAGTIASSDQGMFFCDGSGNATYWSRQFLYNRPVKWNFSDAQPQQLNANSTFQGSVLPWTAVNSTVAYSTAQQQSGVGSMMVTPTGGNSTAGAQSETFTISPSTSYQISVQGFSAIGYSAFEIVAQWYTSLGALISTSSQTIALPAGVWELNSDVFTSPSNAGEASFQVLETGTPSSSAVFWVDSAQFLTVPNSIPYDPSSEFDYDNSFLYNFVQSQRTVNAGNLASTGRYDPINGTWTTSGYGALFNEFDPTSQNEYYPRGPLELDLETTSDQDTDDIVNWNLTAYKQPMLRVAQIVLTPSANPTLWATALGIEQGDVATVSRSPLGGPTYTTTVVVQQVQHQVDADNWVTTVMAVPYFPGQNVLQCDKAGYNVVGSNGIAW